MYNRLTRQTIYALQRHYGRVMYLHYRENSAGTIDYETGAQTFGATVVKVPKAVLLPVNFKIEYYKFSGIQVGDREVILNVEVAPTNTDFLSYEGRRYQIVTVEHLDGAGYHCLIRSTQNDTPYQVFNEIYLETIGVTEDYSDE